MDSTISARPARLDWPDLAKGLCILLVVLHHVTKYAVPRMPDEIAVVATSWFALSAALKPVRMPLFFLVSGLFASRAIHRSWADNRRRLVGGGYLYVVWLLVFWGVYELETTIEANRTQGPADFVGELLWAATSMWFLYAMVVYFALAKALRGLPAWLVLAAAASLSLTTSALPLDERTGSPCCSTSRSSSSAPTSPTSCTQWPTPTGRCAACSRRTSPGRCCWPGRGCLAASSW